MLGKPAGVNGLGGTVAVNGGSLQTTNSGQLASAAILVVNSGSASFGGSETISGLIGAGGTVTVGNNASLTLSQLGYGSMYSGILAGNSSRLNLNGPNLTLAGAGSNTLSGNTSVGGTSASTLVLAKTGGAVAVAGGLVINTGGSVQLNLPNQTAATSPVALLGGTFYSGSAFFSGAGQSNAAGTLLIADAASVIALGSGSHTLSFTGLSFGSGMTVTGWTGTALQSGTGGHLVFSGLGSSPNSTYSSFLSSVTFQNYGPGGAFIASGSNFELVPVPEPAALLAVAVVGLAALLRRRV